MEDKSYKVYEYQNIGETKINDDVIAVIAGLAATEIEGVHSIAGGATNELVSALTKKNLAKGVKVSIDDDGVSLAITIIIEFGKSIPDITHKVQENVSNAVGNMTGLKVKKIDINVSNVNIDK